MDTNAAVRDRAGPALADDSAGVRMVALMRCLLALSALVICYLDPPQPARLIELTYASLAAYYLYSFALAVSVFYRRPLVPARAQHWLDMLFYAYLIGLTAGASAVFFHFFFFAILVASFSRGFGEGLGVTLVSVVLFTLVGALTTGGLELHQALIAPLYLLLLGYMIAWWGGHELSLRRRLRLLKELGALANPRLGVEHTLRQHLRRLLVFFEADACVLVYPQISSADYIMYRVDAQGCQVPQTLTRESAQALIALPASTALAWKPRLAHRPGTAFEQCKGLANLLETSCFVTAPYGQHGVLTGRLYLTSAEGSFSQTEAEFLRQATGQIAASVDNLTLLEELMANAAQLERSRISRDIHDTTIQPYIGLKLGLEALYRKLEPGSMTAAQVQELLAMCTLALDDLRGYVARLRGTERSWAGDELLSAVRRQAGRYRSFYGIEVEVRGDSAVQLTDRIASEAYQIVCEALSNVHRHTGAKRAFIELRCANESLSLQVGNERDSAGPARAFVPRSIAERAVALGGATEVRLNNGGHDIVHVTIPL